ncbi:hypothetical protein [Kordia sp.]|uniref:hypothetical protein n=1 Tax=Kordia sp. TaxID=1965332 RepID=UPI0025BA033F|nr:hypothetical protein [Kordia sp.]MCH2197095.1 hypothetical protein [Kordia sp.]
MNDFTLKAMWKSDLRKLLKPVSRDEAKKIINQKISELRKVDIDEAKNKQLVYKNEVEAVLVYFGYL